MSDSAGAGGEDTAHSRPGDPREVLDRPAVPPDLVLQYGDRPDAVVDVYLPEPTGPSSRGPARLVVLVHGGYWRARYDRSHMRPMAAALRADGVVVALPEFRRVGGGGGWPMTGQDVLAALDGLGDRIEGAAPRALDPAAPFVLGGHSAGGHLAMWAAARLRTSVGRVVALAPVSDLVLAAEMRQGDGAVDDLLGGPPADVPVAYADADALNVFDGDGPPVVIVQGTDDVDVDVELNRSVARRYAGSSRLQYVELQGVEHFALIDPRSAAWPTVRAALLGG